MSSELLENAEKVEGGIEEHELLENIVRVEGGIEEHELLENIVRVEGGIEKLELIENAKEVEEPIDKNVQSYFYLATIMTEISSERQKNAEFCLGEIPYQRGSIHLTTSIVNCNEGNLNIRVMFHDNMHRVGHDYEYEVMVSGTFCLVSPKIQRLQKEIEVNLPLKNLAIAGGESTFNIFLARHCNNDIYKEKPQMEFSMADMLLKKGYYSDCCIKVGDENFPVHEFILTQRSPVFSAMLTTDMYEARNRIIKIEDFSSDTVSAMLDYFYTDNFIPSAKYGAVDELFKIAHKYYVNDLMVLCEEFIIFHLTMENVSHYIDLAVTYNSESLHIKISRFCKKHPYLP